MAKEKMIIYLETLGLCEHCGQLITIQDMPADSMDAEWRCPKCEKVLGSNTFGYEKVGKEGDREKYEKTRWVGPEKKWVEQKPTKDFDLGNWHIMISIPRHYF